MTNNNMTLNQSITMDDLTADEEYITAMQFEDATRTVVRTLGQNFELDIMFAGAGGEAKTDGKVVILPAQDPTKMMTKKQYAVGQGFANHETMHNLCTDMPHAMREFERFRKEGKKLAKAYANAIEDIRIERAAKDLYPGIPSQISSTADYAAKCFIDDVLPQAGDDILKDPKRIGPVAITWRGRQRMGYVSPYTDKVIAMLPKEIYDQVDKWCDMIEKLPTGTENGVGQFDRDVSFKGSRKVIEIAEMFAKETEEVEEEPDPNAGGKQGQGNGGGGNGGNGQNPNSAAGDNGIDNSARRGDSKVDSDPIDPSMDGAVNQLLSQNNGTGWRPVSTALDVMITKTTKKTGARHRNQELLRPENHTMYNELMSNIGGRTAVMKRKFERALLTAADSDYVTGQRAGRLDVRRRGVHIMQGKENIYRKKLDGRNIDTAVSILVDASSSMRGEKMLLASQVCVALAECLEKTSVDLEVLAFRGSEPTGNVPQHIIEKYHEIVRQLEEDRMNGGTKSQLFHRAQPVEMFELKSFDENLRSARISMGAMPRLAGGNTPDGDAILKAAARLRMNPKPKKIMLVLTDGEPGYRCLNGQPEVFTKMAVDYCTKKLGFNMIGVGIQCDAGRKLYKNWTLVNSLEDMDKAIIDNIARMILGENFKVDNGDVSGAAQNFKRRA